MKTALCIIAACVAAFVASAERLAILSDIHVEPGNRNDSVLAVAIDEINAMPDIAAVVVTGDLTNEGSDIQLANVKRHLDRIAKPLVVLPGNHENNWSQSAGNTWLDLWGKDYAAATTPGGLFIVGPNCGPYMKMGDGHIRQEHLHRLRELLDSATAVPGTRVLSICHYPLNHDIDNVAAYIAILEQYPVIAHINGHYHVWQKYRSVGNGIDCLTVRALDTRDGNYGYALLDVGNDSVIASEKIIGTRLPRRVAAWPATFPTPSPDSTAVISPAAPGFTFDRLWTDSASIFTRVTVTPSALLFGTSTGLIKSIDKTDGHLLWSHPTGRPLYSRPLVTAGRVFAATTTGSLLVLDSLSGALLAAIDMKAPVVADPILHNGLIYQGGFRTMIALDPATIRVKWRLDSIGNYCQAAPAALGSDIVFGAWDTWLRLVDASSGCLRWKWSNGRPVNLLSPGNVVPAVTRSRVFIVAPDRFMTALDRATGRVVWRDNSLKYRESIGLSADSSTVYAKTMDGTVVAVDATAPAYTRRWLTDTGIGYDHAPCIVAEARGIVYAGSRRGIVAAIDAADGSLLWTQQLGNGEINSLEVDPVSGDIYLSLIDGTIWRISRSDRH